MSDQPPESDPPAEGPIGHVTGWFREHAGHAEAEAGHVAADIAAALQDHAGTVFDVAGEALQLVKLIDPADAPLVAAAAALVPKVLAMAERAAGLAAAALKGQAAP